jgi:hypothetical protein
LLLLIANDYHADCTARERKRQAAYIPAERLLGHCLETVGGIAFGAAGVGFLLLQLMANRHIVIRSQE